MQLTYKQLMMDHELIAAHAGGLLLRLSDATSPAVGLHGNLQQLACLITEHSVAEDPIAAAVDPDKLGGLWRLTWDRAQAERARLKADWRAFIAQWSLAAIDADRVGFDTAAAAMLDRITDGLRIEAEGLYAVALQTSTIGLR